LRFFMSGAAGFIGSHLCDRLVAEGNEVVGADNLITGSLRNGSPAGFIWPVSARSTGPSNQCVKKGCRSESSLL
jgi:nucleoside-diphosphate-sugar epimerase